MAMITIVTGLPGSGKSTWAWAQAAGTGGYVLDADAVLAAMAGVEIHAKTYPRRDFTALTTLFWNLANELDAEWRNIYLIRALPSDYELMLHAAGCKMVWVETRPELCQTRCAERLADRSTGWDEMLARRNEFLKNHGAELTMVSGDG